MNFLSVSALFSHTQQGSFALKNIGFTQEKFQTIAIAGETGSGKTTLLKIIGGLIQPESGTILFEGKKVLGPDWQLIPGQEGIAFLSQHFELRHHYRMEEILSYANKLSSKDANEIYTVCRIEHLMKRKSDELSGGEKQRIALARLLVSSPRLLLLDEPFSNLDLIHKNVLKKVIDDLGQKLGITCILTSHDPADLLSRADEIIVMKAGEIIQRGAPREIYYRPVNEYAAALFGAYNLFSAAEKKTFGVPEDMDFIRPENMIVSKESGIAKGIVQSVLFTGPFYRLQVLCGAKMIVADSKDGSFTAGNVVWVETIGRS